MSELYDVVQKGECDPIPKQYSKSLVNCIKQMLKVNVKQRISVGKFKQRLTVF